MKHNINAVAATGLSDAALAAVAGVTRLGDVDRAAALRMLETSRGARVWTPRPLTYALQARGRGELSAALDGLSRSKVGTAAKDNVLRRIADLRACEYGVWHR